MKSRLLSPRSRPISVQFVSTEWCQDSESCSAANLAALIEHYVGAQQERPKTTEQEEAAGVSRAAKAVLR
jgi:hypothetical protein